MDLVLEIRALMERTRAATEALLAPVPETELGAQPSTIQPPLVWELAHAAAFEEHWLLRAGKGDGSIPGVHDDVYDALRREQRGLVQLPTLRPDAVRAYAADVRERSLAWLDKVELESVDPLLSNGYVFGLALQNELRQQESMLQALELHSEREYPLPEGDAPDRAPGGPAEIRVSGTTFVMGAVDEPWAYDNELEPHEVELPPFRIDRAPVTNGQFMEFITDRGYRSRGLWTEDGWEWRVDEKVAAPLSWVRGPDGWERVRFGRQEPIPPWEPVQHLSWYEADAFARWAGKRLPTEAEWERAAGWHHREGKQRYPWGLAWTGFEASLDHRRFSPAAAGSYAGGVSPVGCVQMAGDVWEWTSSSLRPYPAFEAFPYPEQSSVYFGDEYRVLRGGSWATGGLVARTTYRAWEYPQRRHLFAGLRLARDA